MGAIIFMSDNFDRVVHRAELFPQHVYGQFRSGFHQACTIGNKESPRCKKTPKAQNR